MPDTIANPKSAIKKKKQTKKTDRAKRACYHCRKAKSSCSNQRPCARCVRLGQADTCIDIPRSDINDEGNLQIHYCIRFYLFNFFFIFYFYFIRKKTLGFNFAISYFS